MTSASKKTIYFMIIACILLGAATLTLAEEISQKSQEEPEVTAPPKPGLNRNIKTIFFNIRPIRCTTECANQTSNKIRKKLPEIPYLEPISTPINAPSDNNIQPPAQIECYTKECALSHAHAYGAERALIGSVEEHEITRVYESGWTEGKTDALYQTQKSYTLKITLIDTDTENIIVTLQEEAEETHLNKAVDRIINRLKKYYQPKKRPKPAPPVIAKNKLPYQLTCAASSIYPLTIYADTARSGFGVQGSILYPGILHPRLVFGANVGYHYMLSDDDDISMYNLLIFSGLAGYIFKLSETCAIIPLAGLGYHMHLIYEKNNTTGNNEHNLYLDPHLQLNLMCNFKLSSTSSFFIAPGYTLFFEKSNNGQYLQIQAGMTWYR